MILLHRLLLGVVGSAVIALFAWRRGSLSGSGALAALAIGTSICVGAGVSGFGVLVTFFVTSTLLGKVGRARKEVTKLEFSKGDRRDGWQALANGGVAAVLALVMLATTDVRASAAFLGALATANGDTWATELGILSRRDPVSVLTLKRVPRGTSGAVSGLGLLATLGGALLVGLVAAGTGLEVRMGAGVVVLTSALGGVVGAWSDSVLGATVQAAFHCETCRRETEGEVHHCGTRTRHVRGWRWFGNDAVNAVATLVGSGVAAAFVTWLGLA
ncbi:MAG: DUF92 domain-containing protein [Myxococcota bacterium]